VKPQNHVEKFVKNASVHVDATTDERWVQSMQDAYNRADAAPVRRYPDYWGLLFESRFVRWAVAAIVFISFVILVGEFGTFLAGGNVAWAEVSQRFQSVPFFYASI
jgi:hypothetical protein